MEKKKEKKSKKKIWFIVLGVVLALVAAFFIYEFFATKVFTQSEYVKEAVIQNSAFNDLTDNFIEEARILEEYDLTTKDHGKRFTETADKITNFVNNLEKKLGPKVPAVYKKHYEKMLEAYKIYLESIRMYQEALAKNPSEERKEELSAAKSKYQEAREKMKTLDK